MRRRLTVVAGGARASPDAANEPAYFHNAQRDSCLVP